MGKLQQARKAKRKYVESLLKRKNVNSVGVGRVWEGGVKTNEVGILVNVDKKEELSALGLGDRIPKDLDGVRVDVYKLGKVAKEDLELGSPVDGTSLIAEDLSYRGEVDDMTMGYSTGNIQGGTGTTGYPALKDGVPGITSNAHVFVQDPSKDLSEVLSQQATGIIQPGRVDGGNDNKQRANLESFYRIETTRRNKIDSAWGRLEDPEDYNTNVPVIGKVYGVSNAEPELGEEVDKVGRTTGYTQGVVEQIDLTVRVNYGNFYATFEDCVATTNMSAGGDSGSIVFIRINGKPYMKYRLFAGSSTATILFPLKTEINKLNLQPILGDDDDGDGDDEHKVEVNFTLKEANGMYTIHGRVSSTAGNPIQDVSLSLMDEDGGSKTTLTDIKGKYEVTNVPEGNYILTAIKEKYTTETKEVRVGNPPNRETLVDRIRGVFGV